MENLTFKSGNPFRNVLPAGAHIVKIADYELVKAEKSDLYEDLTDQVKFRLESDEGIITHYQSIQGFEHNEDGSYIVKDGKRVISKENTDKALGYLGKIAEECGFAKGSDCTLDDLKNKSLGIMVYETEEGYSKVKYTMSPKAALKAKEDLNEDDEIFE